MTQATRAELAAALSEEQEAWHALLPRFSDEQWQASSRADGWTVHDVAGHTADATYGLSRIVLGELQVQVPMDQATGWLNPDQINEERRQRNKTLSREKIGTRLDGAFEAVRRIIDASADLGAPGPNGSPHSVGAWLERIMLHIQSHRQELEQLLAADQALKSGSQNN